MLYFTTAAVGVVTSSGEPVRMAVGSHWLSAQFNSLLQKTTPLATFSSVLSGLSIPYMAAASARAYGLVAAPVHTPNSCQLVGTSETLRNLHSGTHTTFLVTKPKPVLLWLCRERGAVVSMYRWTLTTPESPLHRKINSTGVLGITKTIMLKKASRETLIWRAYSPPCIYTWTQHWVSPLSILATSGAVCPTPAAQSNIHTHPWQQPPGLWEAGSRNGCSMKSQ